MKKNDQSNGRAMRRSVLRRLTTAAVLTSVAFVLSWIEAILPFPIGIPGVKLGLCHIVTLFAVYRLSAWESAAVTAVRVSLASLLFGSVASLAYSAAGAALSLCVMLLLRRVRPGGREAFSPLGVSLAGGVAHNLAQLTTAAALMQTAGVMGYLPVLLIAGTVTGAVIGGVASIILTRVK